MLSQTFLHLPGVTKNTERRLRKLAITTHHEFLKTASIAGIGKKRKLLLNSLLKECITPENLPLSEHWRAYFSTECCFLDCEIDRKGITVLSISDGYESKVFIRGKNLDSKNIQQTLSCFDTIVTFNGASFDLPKLKKEFGINWEGFHIDLKTVARRLDYNGGLKRVEELLGIQRHLDYKVHGGDPALLFRMWRGSGDEYYLRLLVDYNSNDAQNLKRIADCLIPKCKKKMVQNV